MTEKENQINQPSTQITTEEMIERLLKTEEFYEKFVERLFKDEKVAVKFQQAIESLEDSTRRTFMPRCWHCGPDYEMDEIMDRLVEEDEFHHKLAVKLHNEKHLGKKFAQSIDALERQGSCTLCMNTACSHFRGGKSII